MTQGKGELQTMIDTPTLLACGAYVSQRVRSAVCQACYGRHRCRCASGTFMPCVNGVHLTLSGQRSAQHAGGRVNRGFVDVNKGRPGMSSPR